MSNDYRILSTFNLIYFLSSKLKSFSTNYIINNSNLKNIYLQNIDFDFIHFFNFNGIPLKLDSLNSMNNKFKLRNQV